MTNQKLKTESHKGRPIEFSIDESGMLGIEFDDYDCTYRYMSEAKARELRDWLCKAFPVEPPASRNRAPPHHEWDENGQCKWCPAVNRGAEP